MLIPQELQLSPKFAEYESSYDGKTTDRRTAMWK